MMVMSSLQSMTMFFDKVLSPKCEPLRCSFLTGKERDNETGLDWFGPGRYYVSTQGRFTSVDPLMSSGTIYDPQTWNRYSYTLNNPLKWTDLFGLYVWSASLGGNATDEELRRDAKDKKALKQANSIIEACAK